MKNNPISGATGPVVYYSMYGNDQLRTRPSKTNQEKKCRTHAGELFGIFAAAPNPAGHIAIAVIALELENDSTERTLYNRDINWLPAAIVGMGRMKD